VSTVIDADLFEFRDWIYRFRPANSAPSRLLLLIHGLSGDENSMWVFARNLPGNISVLAPRGLYVAREGGYTWRKVRLEMKGLPVMEELCPSADALIGFVDDWSQTAGVTADQIDLVGFSQGAALTYTTAILHPGRIRALAALSGFIPQGAEKFLSTGILAGKPIFVSHGRQDDMVPVELARRSVALLEASGAKVKYCETNGGHKVSLDCFSGLTDIFYQRISKSAGESCATITENIE
jgi:phospholipase/carboxylesterase